MSGVAAAGDDILNSGDDSAGELGGIVDECFQMWHQLCEEESLPEQIKSEIFELALTRFNEKDLKGWDWWWDWMEIAIDFADTQEKQSQIFKALDAIKPKDDDWSAKHDAQTAQKYKLELMSHCGTPDVDSEAITFGEPGTQESTTEPQSKGESTPESNGESTIEISDKENSSIENTNGTTEKQRSAIETILNSIEFSKSDTEHKVMMLLRVDSRLTLDKLYPLLNMSRKGVQKAMDRLKADGRLVREGSTKAGRWIVKD